MIFLSSTYLNDNMASEASAYENVDSVLKTASQAFENRFNCKPSLAAAAPGRVNLIGEHTDYCDGFVFPMVRSPSAKTLVKMSEKC